MSAQYAEEYFRRRTGDQRRAAMMRQEISRLRTLGLPEIGTVLDVGCGTGEFLCDSFFDGWQRYGAEVSEFARKRSETYRIHFTFPRENDWADLVVMRGVLQHLDDPFGALRDAYSALKPGGYLAVLSTPNGGSVAYRAWQTLPCLDPSRNYWIPSARTLTAILVNIGYTECDTTYPYWGTPYARPLKDLAGFVSGRLGAFPGSMMELIARKP